MSDFTNFKKDTLAGSLLEYMGKIEVIDTHEHLFDESHRLQEHVDFGKLFSGYTASDLLSAGMKMEDFHKVTAGELDIEEKWRLFEPYYKKVKNGSYARAARISMAKFYGLSDLNSLEDAVIITERMQKANCPGIYEKVLKEACKLGTILNFNHLATDRELFEQVEFVTDFTEVSTLNDMDALSKLLGCWPVTLNSYLEAIYNYLKKRKQQQHLKGIKLHSAYNRDLCFESTSAYDAEVLFNRIFDESMGMRKNVLGYEEARPLQNFIVHKLAEFAGELELPLVIHSGIAGHRCKQDNNQPLVLWNLFHRYRKTRFIILHAGLPWAAEGGLMAKYFENVYIDMAWDHIISPELSVAGIKIWVDMVPQNKILGFGGDQIVVEKVYGHLQLAKENIARALAAKVEEGCMTEEEAYGWAKAMLYDTPREVYGL